MGLLSKIGSGINLATAAVNGTAIKDTLSSVEDLTVKVREAITGEMSADQKAELETLVQTTEGALNSAKVEMALAESTSQFKSVVLARPMFLYVMYLYLIAALIVGVASIINPVFAVSFAAGIKAFLLAIPNDLWTLFGVGYLGYATVRTIDKKNGTAN